MLDASSRTLDSMRRALVREGEPGTLLGGAAAPLPTRSTAVRHAGDQRQLPLEESRHGDPPYRIAPVQPAAVLDCRHVGALRFLTVACALVLAVVPPLPVRRSTSPSGCRGSTCRRGSRAARSRASVCGTSCGDRARAPRSRRFDLSATESAYNVNSLPARVRPAIWKWDVRDTMPRCPRPLSGARDGHPETRGEDDRAHEPT